MAYRKRRRYGDVAVPKIPPWAFLGGLAAVWYFFIRPKSGSGGGILSTLTGSGGSSRANGLVASVLATASQEGHHDSASAVTSLPSGADDGAVWNTDNGPEAIVFHFTSKSAAQAYGQGTVLGQWVLVPNAGTSAARAAELASALQTYGAQAGQSGFSGFLHRDY